MTISSIAEGEGAISVVVDGDHNVVTIQRGGAKLVLDQRHKWRAALAQTEARSELDLLLTERRGIDLVGREAELASLEAWLASSEPVSFWCVTGRGGAGKTRLGIELCERAEAAGWDSGFARDAELKRFYAAQNIGDWRWKGPTLIVVDYAAASLEILRAWLEELAGLFPRPGQAPLRLLLLEREADSATGWWNRLIGEPSLSARGPDRLVAATEPLRLRPIDEAADRRAILQQVIGQAAQLLGSPAPPLPPAGTNPDFESRLGADDADKEPLYLAMAGLVAVRDGLASALALDRGQLAKIVAGNERRRLERLAKSWGFSTEQTLVLLLAACVTLQDGCDSADLEPLVREEREAGGFPSPLSDAALADRLRDGLRVTGGGRTDAIRPDLIGEAFILNELERLASEKSAALVERAWRRNSEGVVATLIRTAQDFAAFRPDHASVRWLARLVEPIEDPLKLVEIATMLPDQTLALREFGGEVAARLVARGRSLERGDPVADWCLADALYRQSVRLWQLERRDEALAAIGEAVDLHRGIARLHPDAPRNELATLLNAYAIMLEEVAPERALEAAGESVDILRKLEGSRTGDFRDSLATALIGFANVLDQVGRAEEALAAAAEAVAIRQDLAASQPDKGKRELAATLINYSNLLDGEKALASIQEAVLIFRELTALNPDAFRPELAMALASTAARLGDLERAEEALAPIVEAAAIFRELAGLRPDVFRDDLAKTLTIYQARLAALGRDDEAPAVAAEAVELYRAAAAARPEEFRRRLGERLVIYAVSLSRAGRHEDAVEAAAEALPIRRALAGEDPEAYRAGLAMELVNYGIGLAAIGRHEEALRASAEGVAIYRELVASRGGAFVVDLAEALSRLADQLGQARRVEEALAADEEAIGLLAEPFAAQPARLASPMATCCKGYVTRCYDHGYEPNQELLAPINAIFQSLRPPDPKEN